LVHASNFRKVKRVDDVVKIFADVRKKIPAKLLMIGDGPERPAMEELVKDLRVQDDVRFVGKQEQIEEILLVSDLFLLPSEYESFGLAALEAMAASVPVISSNAGGLPEINIHGETGYTINVGDVATMSECAIELLSNEQLLSRMKNCAYKQAQRFDIHNIVPKYENLYSKFCNMECMAGYEI
jgi:N-acetyl-alpha-D-glucosaminyl L-malate synthase BshA